MEIPELNKTYNCFDDGKISKSRLYEVTITEIIPFKDADEFTINLWKNEGLSRHWLFDKTDYFIKFKSTEHEDYPDGVFARTKHGWWFGLGNYWNSGQLDLDGKLTIALNELYK